jgi:glutamyl-tRNA synthetase
MTEANVRVRYAPSPTGYPHIGNIRTALFNWLYARHSGGKFIVRIEDTDQQRRVEGAEDAILNSLDWLKMDWDEGPRKGGDYGPYFQSERLDLYHKHVQRLLEAGYAYRCYCSPERLTRMRSEMAERKESMRSYDRRCRDLSPEEQNRLESKGKTPVIRFKMPLDGQTTFNDLIRGDITFDNSELDDIVILKSDGYPTYHLANIVDDHFMEISHIMRADEWLSSTPRHILLYRALDWKPPLFAHLPMILGPDKAKLSKRHGATSLVEYREQGYLPDAMVNFLALLGWSLDDKTEIFSREELIQQFSIERISKTPAIFNREKLDWMNGLYIRKDMVEEVPTARAEAKGLPPEAPVADYTVFIERLQKYWEDNPPEEFKRPTDDYLQKIAPLIYERIKTWKEVGNNFGFFFTDELVYDANLLLGKKLTRKAAIAGLEAARQKLQDVPFDAESLEGVLRQLSSELGMKAGDFFDPLRVATTGRTAAPPLFHTMEVLGKEKCLDRIEKALVKLRNELPED